MTTTEIFDEELQRPPSVFSIESVQDEIIVPRSAKESEEAPEIRVSRAKRLERKLSITSLLKRVFVSTLEELDDDETNQSSGNAIIPIAENSVGSIKSRELNVDLPSSGVSPVILRKKSKRSSTVSNTSAVKQKNTLCPSGVFLPGSDSGGSISELVSSPSCDKLTKTTTADHYSASKPSSRISSGRSSFTRRLKVDSTTPEIVEEPSTKVAAIDRNEPIPNTLKEKNSSLTKSSSIGSQLSQTMGKSATSSALSILKMFTQSNTSDKRKGKKDKNNDVLLHISKPGTEGEGPWTDSVTISPIVSRKLVAGNEKLHVITIGREFLKDSQRVRRVKIYEHDFVVPDGDLERVSKMMQNTPEKALVLANVILRAPNTGRKLTDKVMTKELGLKGIIGAQTTLQPLFGAWLNPLYVEENGLYAATDAVYLLEHSHTHGTAARCLKSLARNSSREEIRDKLTTGLGEALEYCWDAHPSDGVSIAVATPLGSKGSRLFC